MPQTESDEPNIKSYTLKTTGKIGPFCFFAARASGFSARHKNISAGWRAFALDTPA
jgi:hypothetical protein